MTWALIGVGAAAAIFFGLWQRERASRAAADAALADARAKVEHGEHLDDVGRLEAVARFYRDELAKLEERYGKDATLDGVRARLDDLLRAPAGPVPEAPDVVPAGPASGDHEAVASAPSRVP